jgi:hypothetical protein
LCDKESPCAYARGKLRNMIKEMKAGRFPPNEAAKALVKHFDKSGLSPEFFIEKLQEEGFRA